MGAIDTSSGNSQPGQPPDVCSSRCGSVAVADVVCQSGRPGKSTGAGPPAAVVCPPHADVSPSVASLSDTAPPGATVIEDGDVITFCPPVAMPVHGPSGVHVVPSGRTTVLAELPASGGRQNTAPPGGGSGADCVRRQAGSVGALSAIVVGPQRTPGPWPQAEFALFVDIRNVSLTSVPSRLACPMPPPSQRIGVTR